MISESYFLYFLEDSPIEKLRNIGIGGERVRIEGQDPLLRLLQQLNKSNGNSSEEIEKIKPEEALKELKRNLLDKDQFHQQGENGAMEVQFFRKPGESPESYLQRISAAVIKQREMEKEMLDNNQDVPKTVQDAITQTALYHELAKDSKKNENAHPPMSGNITFQFKLLHIFAILMFISILLYIVFHL